MTPTQWKNFTPLLDVWGAGAGATFTPVLGSNGQVQEARYLHIPEWRLCIYQFWIGFGSVNNSGGTGYYLIKLPMPAKRFAQNQLTNNDRPYGSGFITQGASQQPSVPLSFIASDFGGRTYGRNKNSFVQAFVHGMRMSGTATITSGNTSVAVTWPGGITLNYAPNPSDLIVNETAAATTITGKDVFITNVSTTGFTINVNTSPGSSGLPFAWKLAGDNQLLLGSAAPWNVGGALDFIRGSITYETAA